MKQSNSSFSRSLYLQRCLMLALLFGSVITNGQDRKITVEDIWSKGLFFGENYEGLSFSKDENYYTYLDYNPDKQTLDLVQSPLTGTTKTILIPSSVLISTQKQVVPESYAFSDDDHNILLLTAKVPVYRRSFTADYYIYNQQNKSLKALSDAGKQAYATFSPDGKSVAFVRNNNLFIKDLESNKEIQITTDGVPNKIINGSADWVYEEEFEFAKAFFWSPDSKNIAYYKFNEEAVKEYSLQTWTGLYPQIYKYKYPKAGEANSIVSIHNYTIATGKTTNFSIDKTSDFYYPRVQWTKNPELLSIMQLNRNQNHLKILHANLKKNSIEEVYEEKNKNYVEVNDNLIYLKDGTSFILTSEKDGYRHLYQYDMSGKLINKITNGNWEIIKFLGIDEQKGKIYYTSNETAVSEQQLFVQSLKDKSKKQLTKTPGTHEITCSPNFKYIIDEQSRCNVPPQINLLDQEGNKISQLMENAQLQKTIEEFKFTSPEFFSFKNAATDNINAFMIKPPGFDPRKKYPVLVYVYGGPGSQNVVDAWKGPDYAWYQLLAQKGYLIVTMDGRGTGGRGAEFKKISQGQLGKYEIEDIIALAQYLGAQAYVEKSRIGIFGWSFGGYLSSLAMTVGADYFKAGIAVAPVISWRYYDSIYTERFLGDPKDNASGYDDNSPLTHAAKLKGNYLLIHGTADDNVHVQNSMEMEKALIQANKPFQVFYYPDKNHGIYGGNTRLHLYTMMTEFLIKNL